MESHSRALSPMSASWVRERYFSSISIAILALSVWGFSDNLIWNVRQPSNSDPKFVIHGAFCLTWMLLFAVQANLVRTGRMRVHRKLGIAAFLTAAGVTVSTIYVFAAVWKGWDAMTPIVKANRLLLPSYSVLVLIAFFLRRRPDFHKRLLLIATLFMLEPVLSRSFDPIEPLLLGFTDSQVDFSWWIFFVTAWNGLFLSLFAYDWLTERKIHPVTIAGFGWFCAIWIAVRLI